MLSRSSISVFTSTLFDFFLTEAKESPDGEGDDLRRRCILFLARVIEDDFPASDFLGSKYARRAVDAARHAALEERRDDETFVAALEEKKRLSAEADRLAALEAKQRLGRVAALEVKKRRALEEKKRRGAEAKVQRARAAEEARVAEKRRAAEAKAKKERAAARRAAEAMPKRSAIPPWARRAPP